jgi:hypothetical protein
MLGNWYVSWQLAQRHTEELRHCAAIRRLALRQRPVRAQGQQSRPVALLALLGMR